MTLSLKVFHHTGMTSLLQPSQAVFDTFHRLVLLTPHGEVAYSGHTSGAVSHFTSLGLMKPDGLSDPEFLLQCAADPASVYMSSEESNCDIQDVPHDIQTPGVLAKAFTTSPAGKALQQEMDQVLSGEHPVLTKQAKPYQSSQDQHTEQQTVPPPFALSTTQQIMLLMGRGFKLVVRNPVSTMRAVSAMIIGLIIGTLFLNTANDADGTRIRSGYLLCLLFISFLNSSMAGLEDLYADRITFYVHREASVRFFLQLFPVYLSRLVFRNI
jgi:ABC-2 type transporter